MGLNPDNGSCIQFNFRKCLNLRRKNGGIPNAAVYAQYKDNNDQKCKTLVTTYRKANDPEWHENTTILQNLKPGTEFTFVVLDAPSAPLLRPTKIAVSKAYTFQALLLLRKDAESATKPDEDPSFAIPLNATHENESSPSLVLSVRDFLTDIERRKFFAKVHDDWKSKNRKDLDVEIASFTRELQLLSADVPSTTNVKTLVDVTTGLFISLAPLLENSALDDRRLVVDLISSYRRAFAQIRLAAIEEPAEVIVQFYGKACLEVAKSLRFLEHCLRKPTCLTTDPVIAEIHSITKSFEDFDSQLARGQNLSLHHNLVLGQRANLRKGFIASNPTIISKLNPVFDMEPSQIFQIRARHGSSMITQISSWAILSAPAEMKRLIWLNGSPGCGKTQLANSLIDAFGRIGVSSAYFTFNNHSDDDKDATKPTEPPSLESMTKTLAFQLAAYVDTLASGISNVVYSTKDLENLDFPQLFERFIISPLQNLQGKKPSSDDDKPADPVLIMLDDLEQCTSAQVDQLLTVLTEALPKLPKQVRVLLLSRPVSSIQTALEDNTMASVIEYNTESVNSGNGSPTSPTFLFGQAQSSRPSSIKWAMNGSGSSSGSGSRRSSIGSLKGKRTSGTGSLGSINEVLEVVRDGSAA